MTDIAERAKLRVPVVLMLQLNDMQEVTAVNAKRDVALFANPLGLAEAGKAEVFCSAKNWLDPIDCRVQDEPVVEKPIFFVISAKHN